MTILAYKPLWCGCIFDFRWTVNLLFNIDIKICFDHSQLVQFMYVVITVVLPSLSAVIFPAQPGSVVSSPEGLIVFFLSCSFTVPGPVLSVLLSGGRPVRLHPQLQWLLHWAGWKQHGCGMPPAAKRDHCWLWCGENFLFPSPRNVCFGSVCELP